MYADFCCVNIPTMADSSYLSGVWKRYTQLMLELELAPAHNCSYPLPIDSAGAGISNMPNKKVGT